MTPKTSVLEPVKTIPIASGKMQSIMCGSLLWFNMCNNLDESAENYTYWGGKSQSQKITHYMILEMTKF